VIHECAHGLVAKWCGDNTAYHEGRITLNPIKHIDLWGTIIIPILLIVTGSGVMFGWAKPVPVNPYNFRNMKRDDIYVSLAGPGSNLIMAFLSAVLIILINIIGGFFLNNALALDIFNSLLMFFQYSILINLVLAVFNMIPIPPLDGSHFIANLLPDKLADQYRSLGFMGMFILVALMATGIVGSVITPIIGSIFDWLDHFINYFSA
jgi:Zn-dependent protease